MKRGYAIAAVAVAAALAASSCSGSSVSDNSTGGGPGSSSFGGSNGSSSGTSSFSPGTAAADASGPAAPPLPPEMKSEGAYQTPVATRNIVWIANPTSGRVAYIDAQSFGVQTIEAGNGPTYVAAIPDPTDDVAIVQNVLSQNATLLRHYPGMLPAACPSAPNEPKTTPINGICATPLASTRDANGWAVSASGRWAIAWTDTTRISNADATQSFQDVAVLDLSLAKPATILAVGYRPVKMAFSGDDAFAYAVTEDGITVIDLLSGSQPKAVQNFPLTAPPIPADAGASDDASDSSAGDTLGGDAANDASDSAVEGATAAPPAVGPVAMGPPVAGRPDVSFTPDGSYALVRNEGISSIAVVSLKGGATTRVPLQSIPSDLTVSPKGDFAVAVLRDRDSSAVAILPVPGIVSAPSSLTAIPIPGETVGRAIVTKDGKSVLLFTTAVPIERLTVLTLGASASLRTITLHAPVLAVFPTDDGQNAIVLHNVTPTQGNVAATPGANVKGAFTIVPIAVPLPAKIVSLPATPIAVALAPTSDRALVSMSDSATNTFGAYLAMMPSLEVRPYVLASPPIAVGIAAGTMPARGYIAQDYAEGRITFVDLTGGAERTITGFELGARIVPGSKP